MCRGTRQEWILVEESVQMIGESQTSTLKNEQSELNLPLIRFPPIQHQIVGLRECILARISTPGAWAMYHNMVPHASPCSQPPRLAPHQYARLPSRSTQRSWSVTFRLIILCLDSCAASCASCVAQLRVRNADLQTFKNVIHVHVTGYTLYFRLCYI